MAGPKAPWPFSGGRLFPVSRTLPFRRCVEAWGAVKMTAFAPSFPPNAYQEPIGNINPRICLEVPVGRLTSDAAKVSRIAKLA